MISKKDFAIGFTIAFIILTIYIYNHNDKIASTIANDGSYGVLWYIISNPAYILLFFSILIINQDAGFIRNTIGGSMIIYASDIISYPRLSPLGLPKDFHLLASSDGLVIHKLLAYGMDYSTAYNLYYLILPIALALGGLAILGIANFFRIFGRGKQ